ncbi:MAG: hypothetical protein WCE53_03935 [Candidatus Acidiferrum sp.]
MTRIRKTGLLLGGFLVAGFLLHEAVHFFSYGHLVPVGLHVDVDLRTSADVLGVDGTALIYDAKLTNYSILPLTIVVCDSMVANMPFTNLNYIVERWDRQSDKWVFVPEWDIWGYRLFCHPGFEVTEEHLSPRRLWPGQSIEVGECIPAQWGNFHIGDHARFTVFLRADGNSNHSLSSASFRVVQQPRTSLPVGGTH